MKYIKSIMVIAIAAWVSSCGEPELPFDRFEDVNYGAYARRLAQSGSFDYFNVTGSTVNVEVEFYDEDKGQNIERYEWTVRFISNGGNGGNDVDPVAFATFTSGEFAPNGDGLPGLSFSFGMQAALDAMGIDGASLTAGDLFRFDATVHKSDGTSFTLDNTGTNIISSASFAALFRLDMPVVCLFEDTKFVGSYAMTQGAVTGAFGAAFEDQDVTVSLVDGSPTKRSFDAIYLEALAIGNGPATIIFDLVCNIVVPDASQNSGLACAGGIAFNPPATPAAFNIDDDSSFDVIINEGLSDCGAADTDITLTFTKN